MTDQSRIADPRPAAAAEFPPDVAVAIVAHDSRGALPATLAALAAAGCPTDRITVVDVASGDGTVDWLAGEHPGIRVRRLDRNEGPNPGRNVGITEASQPLVLLMDADVRVAPDAVQRLRAAMRDDRSIKVGSPIVVDQQQPDRIQYAGGAIHFICEAVNPWAGRTLAERGSAPEEIGAASACALLVEREVATEIGLFDERYFMGKDDGDFIHRMRIAGHKVWEVPQAIVLHNTRPRSDWMFYYQIRNRWHFILKNYEARTILSLVPILLIHEPLQLAVLTLKGHLGTYCRAIGGLLRLLPSVPRDRAFVRRLRRVHDRDLLVSAPMVVRGDLTSTAIARQGKRSYDDMLVRYWRRLTGTTPAR